MKHGGNYMLKIKKIIGGKRAEKTIIAVVAVVFVFVVLGNIFPSGSSSSDNSKNNLSYEDSYISDLELKLKNVLSKTKGVGGCEIVITVTGGSEYVYATETYDKNQSTVNGDKTQIGSDSKTSVKTVTEQRDEKPLIEKEIFPEIKGVVIICEGGGNSGIKNTVTNIVSVLLGITKDKVIVEEKR